MLGKVTALTVWAFTLACAAAREDSREAKNDTTAATDTTAKSSLDEDIPAIGGTGVPTGYRGRTDRPNMQLSAAKYAVNGKAWEVTTGPAHILYRPVDTASGSYTVAATIDQLEAPAHPEAYGIFIGGQNLEDARQRYLYFLVRGAGEMFVKVREGDKTRGVIDWQASKAVPTASSTGKGTYKIGIQVAPDSVRFWVNDQQAAAVSSAGLPTSGVYGLRINHNLHVRATPVTLGRP